MPRASLRIDRRIDSGGVDRFATDDDHHEYRRSKTIALRQLNTGSLPDPDERY